MADDNLSTLLYDEVDQYKLMIMNNRLQQSLSIWRQQATKLEMLLTDCMDYQCLKRELDVFVKCMDNVDDVSTNLYDLYPDIDHDDNMLIDIENCEIDHHNLIKQMNSKLRRLAEDAKSNVSKVSNLSSHNSGRSDIHMQAAATAAELEVKLHYMHTGLYSEMVANQCELDQIRTERELAIAKARLRAVNEVHDSDAMSQTLERLPDANYIESVMQGKCVNNPGNEVDSRFEGNGVLTPDMSQLLERLPDANYIESVMQGKCVNNPGNEVDIRFEGNGVLTPDMSQLLERLPDANCVDGLMQGDFVHNPGNEVDSQFDGNGVVPPGDCGIDDMSQLLERLPDANCVDGLMQGDFVHNPGNEVDSQFDGNGVVPPGDCGIDDMSQLLERLPDANCVDGLMQGDSVHNPGNELDTRFEANGVVSPGGCFGTSSCGSLKSTLLQCPIYDAPTVVGSAQRQLPCPLDVRFGEPFVVGNAFSDKVDNIDTWHGSVSRVDLGLRSFPDCPSQCETTIANLGPFGDDREMQTLQNQRSEWMVHRIAPLQEVEVALLIGHNCSEALMSRDVVPSLNNEPYARCHFWAGA